MFCWWISCAGRSGGPARVVRLLSTYTRRVCPPVREPGFPTRGGRLETLLLRPALAPGARRPPPPGGTGAPLAARLPCPDAASTPLICERTMSWRLLIPWIQDQSHGAGEYLPFGLLACKLLAPQSRKAIEPGTLTSVGQIPGS